MKSKLLAISLSLGLALFAGGSTLWAADCNCENKTYTLDVDFDEGTLVNVNHESPNNDQLQLDSEATPFGFIWVAVSSQGTVVQIDTETGAILGEFFTTPSIHWAKTPKEALDFVSRIDSKIVLIDGQTLAQHMIDHSVGVSTVASYDVKKIDSDYFLEP